MHATHTYPREPPRPSLKSVSLGDRATPSPEFRVGHWLSVGRAATRCGDNLDLRERSGSQRVAARAFPNGLGCECRTRPSARGLRTACMPRMCSGSRNAPQARMCVGCVPGGEGRISAPEQVFPVMTCVDDRCVPLARARTRWPHRSCTPASSAPPASRAPPPPSATSATTMSSSPSRSRPAPVRRRLPSANRGDGRPRDSRIRQHRGARESAALGLRPSLGWVVREVVVHPREETLKGDPALPLVSIPILSSPSTPREALAAPDRVTVGPRQGDTSA
jgi:hypothetical protein